MSRFVSLCILVLCFCLPALADLPTPVAKLALPAPGNSNAFDINARYDSTGHLYVWDGANLWKQSDLNSPLSKIASNLGSGSADAGPVNFSPDGATLFFGNGAGGMDGMITGASNGLIYSFNLATGASQLVADVNDHLDFIPLSNSALLVNSAVGWTSSQVSIASLISPTNTPVIVNIPGAATSLALDNASNLYVGVGYGADRGDIRKFPLASLQNASTPLDWTLGTLLNPDSSDNNSGAGMFFDSRGYLFVGGNEGLTVFGPDGKGVSYDVGPGFSRLAYNPAADQFLVLSYASNNGAVYNASAFIPEPGALLLLPLASAFLLRRKLSRKLAPALLVLPLSLSASASGFFAETVISSTPGTSQAAYFNDPALALGAPKGQGDVNGSLDVYNLGVGGSLTLGFTDGKVLSNLPGADFIVYENPIAAGASVFAELLFVEVSSDGVHFARFPVSSSIASPVSAYGTINPNAVWGFAGVHPVYANPDLNIDPLDPLLAGGDAFDLSALVNDPLVLSGDVNLGAITQIRLIDVIGDGSLLDTVGRPIYDPTGVGTNGADLDAVAILHTVPEPATLLLPVAFGLLALRRKK